MSVEGMEIKVWFNPKRIKTETDMENWCNKVVDLVLDSEDLDGSFMTPIRDTNKTVTR